MSYYLYTETAFHHMGEMDFIKGLIDASKRVGAKGVKFQVLIDYDSFMSQQHSMYEGFKKGTFTAQEWREIFEYTNASGLDIIFMPLCVPAFDLLKSDKYKIKYIDIHSVSFYDEAILKEIKNSGIPVILGVGGRTSSEIDEKIAYFGTQLEVIMVGFQAFPSQIEDLRLGKIKWLKEKYTDRQVGYADHSSYENEHCVTTNEWAYILGARFFEKHITTDEGAERWDFQSAMGEEKFNQMVAKLDFLDKEVFKYSEEDFDKIEDKELTYRNRQKILVAATALSKGHVVGKQDIAFKMIDNAVGVYDDSLVIGKTLIEDIPVGGKIVPEFLS